MLRGVPPPEWTKRPNAKDGCRARAIELRGPGRSVPDISAERGVARSTAYQWVRHYRLSIHESGVVTALDQPAAEGVGFTDGEALG